MKRIVSACLEQTSRFESERDFNEYIERLEKKYTKYKIISTEKQPDSSVLTKVKLQYLNYDTGDYLN